jgi:DNA-directed RNA polymerase specialized sigma24 family protein
LDEIVAGEVTDTAEIANREGCSERSVRQRLSLAFVAQSIV